MKSLVSIILTFLGACLLAVACIQPITSSGSAEDRSAGTHAPLSRNNAAAVRSLGETLARCYWAFLVELSWDESPIDIFLTSIDIYAQRLTLDLSSRQIKAVREPAEFVKLVVQTREQIGADYGKQAQALFNYSYNLQFVLSMLPSLSNSSPEVSRRWTILLATNLLEATRAAQELGIEQAVALRGAAIAGEMVKGLAPSDIEDIEQQIDEWKQATEELVGYLARGAPTPPPTPTGVDIVGIDLTQILPPGNVLRGENLMLREGCIGCHALTDVEMTGPTFGLQDGKTLAGRVEDRIHASDYEGAATTVEQYLLESIVLPNVYIVPGYPAGVQPQNYGERLTTQEVSDLIAYLLSLK